MNHEVILISKEWTQIIILALSTTKKKEVLRGMSNLAKDWWNPGKHRKFPDEVLKHADTIYTLPGTKFQMAVNKKASQIVVFRPVENS